MSEFFYTVEDVKMGTLGTLQYTLELNVITSLGHLSGRPTGGLLLLRTPLGVGVGPTG